MDIDISRLLLRLVPAGLRANRLRLTGHDADLLIKLEMLAGEVSADQQTVDDHDASLHGDAATGNKAQHTGDVLQLISTLLD